MSGPPVRFLADAMLGRLARWLRALGFDTAGAGAAPDAALVRQAAAEGRVLLTRDRHLLRELRPVRALAIEGDGPVDQLRQVVAALALTAPPGPFTRCLLCNAALDEVPEAEWPAVVPAKALALSGPVRRCAECGRVYWPGSHVRRLRRALAEALPGWLPDE